MAILVPDNLQHINGHIYQFRSEDNPLDHEWYFKIKQSFDETLVVCCDRVGNDVILDLSDCNKIQQKLNYRPGNIGDLTVLGSVSSLDLDIQACLWRVAGPKYSKHVYRVLEGCYDESQINKLAQVVNDPKSTKVEIQSKFNELFKSQLDNYMEYMELCKELELKNN